MTLRGQSLQQTSSSLSISSQQLRSFCRDLVALGIDLSGKRFVLCMKGLEIGTGKRLTTVFYEELGSSMRVAVWVGPGHVQDFVRGIPNCMVIAAREMKLTRELVDAFSGFADSLLPGSGSFLGTEIGAASKNVIGLAAGMLDGFGYSSLKGALMARGTHELSRLIEAMGGDRMTVYGLSHLGDYEATLFSPHSNNRRLAGTSSRASPSRSWQRASTQWRRSWTSRVSSTSNCRSARQSTRSSTTTPEGTAHAALHARDEVGVTAARAGSVREIGLIEHNIFNCFLGNLKIAGVSSQCKIAKESPKRRK